jgi:hypothetical protein
MRCGSAIRDWQKWAPFRSAALGISLDGAERLIAEDVQVIEDPDVQPAVGLPKPAGQDLIGLGRFSDAAGMWVRQH